ncbi:MAG: tRNA (guanosine(46)-N7)-methyltransferase TrmB [Flavobacteriia bacterium]|nr:tRNA (guanosine(46)-N7)-methyltransferase TrmB [Flavobacteriia bacterium]
MAKNKLRRFKEMEELPNVIQPNNVYPPENDFYLKGKWKSDFFKNNNKIILELGCGKGEYSVELAKKYPNNNYIGIDIKGARIWVGAKSSHELSMTNVAFLRIKIDFIDHFFDTNEVDEIWLTFSDPQPEKPNKRLTSPFFREKYKKILKKEGMIHLKTDSDLLYDYTLEEIEKNQIKLLENISNIEHITNSSNDTLKILNEVTTHYEKLFSSKGMTIKYLKFSL